MKDASAKKDKVNNHIRTIDGWQYYNHAMIPASAPHEAVDLSAVLNGNIWNYRNGKRRPLLARWTSDWDCGKETGWWYVIREKPFELSDLSSSARRNIKKALRNCRVEKIDAIPFSDDLWRVYLEAVSRYKNYRTPFDKERFSDNWINSDKEFWAGFDHYTGRMIGFAVFDVHPDWVEYQIAKYSAQYLKLRVSDAINATALDYYLNKLGKWYVSDGERSVLHKTNVQTYLVEHFRYRKAFCKLHIRFRKRLNLLIKILYPFRKGLRLLDGVRCVHRLNSLLLMEQIARSQA